MQLTRLFGVGPLWGLTWMPYLGVVVWADWSFAPSFRLAAVPYAVCAVLAAVLLLAGLVVIIWSGRAVHAALARDELCTTGPYARVRHPLYAAWIFLLLPAGALLLQSWLLLTVPLVAWLGFWLVIRREERQLEAQFGEAYRTYRTKTPALWPRVGGRVGG